MLRDDENDTLKTSVYSSLIIEQSQYHFMLKYIYIFYWYYILFYQVTFSSLDVHLHTEALLNTMNFLSKLLPETNKKEGQQEELPTIPEEDEAEAEREEEKKEETAVTRKKCKCMLLSQQYSIRHCVSYFSGNDTYIQSSCEG